MSLQTWVLMYSKVELILSNDLILFHSMVSISKNISSLIDSDLSVESNDCIEEDSYIESSDNSSNAPPSVCTNFNDLIKNNL